MVRALAHAHERNSLLARWTLEQLRSAWRSWSGATSVSWTQRLVESVCLHRAITFLDPPTTAPTSGSTQGDSNCLPLLLKTCAPILWFAQNMIQALLITSLLALLAPAASSDLAARILNLLRVDMLAPPSEDHTDLADLEKLLIAGCDVSVEDRKVLRGRIEKILRSEDPVWALLAQRLAAALACALAPSMASVPDTLQTGLILRPTSIDGKRRMVVKGFEGEALEEAAGEVLAALEGVREWVGEGWADVLRK